MTAVIAEPRRWIEPGTLKPAKLPGEVMAWLVGAPGRPGMRRAIIARSAEHPPSTVEVKRKGRRDVYRRDDKAITLTYRYVRTEA